MLGKMIEAIDVAYLNDYYTKDRLEKMGADDETLKKNRMEYKKKGVGFEIGKYNTTLVNNKPARAGIFHATGLM